MAAFVYTFILFNRKFEMGYIKYLKFKFILLYWIYSIVNYYDYINEEIEYNMKTEKIHTFVQLEKFYHKYKLDYFKYILKFTGDYDVAEDLLQEVFIIIAEKFYTLRDIDKFKSWGFQITANVCRQWYNKRKKENLIQTDDIDKITNKKITVNQDTPTGKLREIINSLLNTIDHEEKEVFILKYYENMYYDQIAKILGLSKRTVRRRMYSASEKITKRLEKSRIVVGKNFSFDGI